MRTHLSRWVHGIYFGSLPDRYRYYRGQPLFKYGHGESYTTWRFNWAIQPPTTMTTDAAASGFPLSIAVANTGIIASDIVVLAFGSLSGVDCPLRTLMGFERLSMLRPHSTAATVRVGVAPRTLGCVDDAGVRRLSPGALSLTVGDLTTPAKHNITLTGASIVLPF